ncbi:MAG: aspartate/methionine/tyrosine aminotransferase [Candidatus Marinamargulisbacteria bacterium]|jgi:aspartate/methionine/tyrosine aminotransferase
MQYHDYLLEAKEYPLVAIQKKVADLRQSGAEIINLTIGDPKDPTYSGANQAAQQFLEDHPSSQYPSPYGSDAYRTAVSDWARRHYSIELDPMKHILSCNGTKEAIYSIPEAFDWSRGQRIFIPSPSYPVYEASARIRKIETMSLVMTESTGFLPDLEAVSAAQWQTCQLFWINSPQNPTTAIAPKSYFSRLLALAKKYDFLVCSDECYNEIYFGDRPTSCLDFPDSTHWLVFKSLSKRSHMTGYRMGALLTKNESLIKILRKQRSPAGIGSPGFIQASGTRAWQDESHVQAFRDAYLVKRNLLKTALEKKGFQIFGADAGFYFWFRHSALPTSESITDYFLAGGIMITPGEVFGKSGEGYARMVFCESMKLCEKVANKIDSMLDLS